MGLTHREIDAECEITTNASKAVASPASQVQVGHEYPQKHAQSCCRRIGKTISFQLQITVRNPGCEGKDNALSMLVLQFEDEDKFKECVDVFSKHLRETPGDHIVLRNETGEAISFNPMYYHSLWAGSIEWPMPDWLARNRSDGN